DIDKYNVPEHWFGKKLANDTLKRTPLYLQLSGSQNPTGKRKSGTVEKALNSSRKAFEKINKDISESKSGKIGDQPFNKDICLEFCYTLDDTPGNLADYVLRKLNTYMKQLEQVYGRPQDLFG
ncbi:MAG: ATP-binding protein, partial [Dolichospermum sp.]